MKTQDYFDGNNDDSAASMSWRELSATSKNKYNPTIVEFPNQTLE
jgi:hypothetical protein